ncbi:glucosamine 6-phosphate N-acetyltransferase [Coemansia reversa NRRL 1564]|uniref:Glucosamine 6-phosphate N-acetyltransferase n=1 Tax=Coemansia reversa (strain ATCC 12441 / NRRL 1564) TaxID=763665 RepID=A0A2G5BD34_COERN|nr:glucosamine 6-phosphate N-acetyltransferase [Coemansia reversa NRRL 1564]|eukprot:PIA16913.1 glucosamine 6-phosphate N-acetyltransferase [Coemansia reversa NRRL 1564]
MVSSNSLFDSSVLGNSVASMVPDNHKIRPLELTDYHKGYLECLSNLTVVGNVTEQMFGDSFEEMQRTGSYFVVVVEDLASKKVVASGTLLVEQKFHRGCGRVGHIEDIVVAKGQQGKRFGFTIVKQLLEIANATGCYKSILDCDAANAPFYEKCGMENKGVQMAVYAPDTASKKSLL